MYLPVLHIYLFCELVYFWQYKGTETHVHLSETGNQSSDKT